MLHPTTLRPILATLALVAKNKTSLPILSAIHIRHDEKGTTLAATDLENHLTYCHPLPDPGTLAFFTDAARRRKQPPLGLCVPLQALLQIVGKVESIAITTEKDGLSATLSGESKNKAGFETITPVFPSEDFPPPAKLDPKQSQITIPALGARLDVLQPMISRDQTRYVLNGIHLAANGSLVATDGRMMGISDTATESATTRPPPTAIIPTATVSLLISLLKNTPGAAVTLLADRSHNLQFQIGPWSLTCKGIDSTYPNYQQVVPAYDDWAFFKITANDCARLHDTLSRLKTDKDSRAKISLTPDAWCVDYEGCDGTVRQSGAITPTMMAVSALKPNPPPTTPIRLNPVFCSHLFRAGRETGLTLHTVSADQPVVATHKELTIIVMPIRDSASPDAPCKQP